MTAAVGLAKVSTHEEIFLERYDQLLKWASHLTRPDHELARDLVQEAFLQFSLSVSDLVGINKIDNYLYGVVRNTYRSHLRRSPRHFYVQLDSDAMDSLRLSVDPRDRFRAKDELVAICKRACARKETSVAASLLILRFFHGYSPGEIARLTHRSRNVVDVQIKLARWEATSSPLKRNLIVNSPSSNVTRRPQTSSRKSVDLVTELREEVFCAVQGDCFEAAHLQRVVNSGKPMPRSKLSHLVSCMHCLELANDLLGLASLKDRNVWDVLERAQSTVAKPSCSTFVLKALSLIGGWSLWICLTTTDFFDVLT